MILTVDAGNTNIVLGIYRDGSWLDHWRIQSVPERMSDEYTLLLRGLLAEAGIDGRRFRKVVLSSVVPPLTGTITETLRRITGYEPLVVSPRIRTGLTISTDNPAEVGSDLIANAVAAYAAFGSACIIVDFGTALTFTAVSGKGEILGASIAPGPETAAEALSLRAAQLPHISLTPPPAAIGTNTVHSIQSGIVFGYVGLVEKIVSHIRSEIGDDAKVVATGGLSDAVAPLTDVFDLVDSWLTLDGLRRIAEMNP